jgi:hypothetical protein
MRRLTWLVVAASVLGVDSSRVAMAQSWSGASAPPRPQGSVSFYATTMNTQADGGFEATYALFTTAVTYRIPDQEADGLDYGIDLRHSTSAALHRPQRLSVYEGYVGARFGGGTRQVRAGQLWVSDLGGLGAVAGGLFEIKQAPGLARGVGRLQVGVFGGLEPDIYKAGYAANVRKYGGYATLAGEGGRRHAVGFVAVRDGSVAERSVLTFTNFLPLGRNRFFLYQAAEYDLARPAGRARGGLSYFFSTARFAPVHRVELQGTYNRGRAIDSRGLSDDVLNGRPIKQSQVDGLLYASIGGRVTVEVARRVRVFGGYSRDQNNRDEVPTRRVTLGGYGGNLLNSGFDVSATDSLMDRTTGAYHSRFVSVGRQIGRRVYLSGDYTRSLAVVRFSRSDGLVVQQEPRTQRLSGSGVFTLSRTSSLTATIDRTLDDRATALQVMVGVTHRF